MEIECVNKCGNLTDSPDSNECETCREATTNAIKPLDILSKIFQNDFAESSQNVPYRCQGFYENPELMNLQRDLFRENFYQLESESGELIPAYERDIGSYDEPCTEILTEKEWLALPKRPTRIDELKTEIRKAQDNEFLNGIKHHRHFTTWGSPEIMAQKIDVPELKINYEAAVKK